MKPLDNNKKYDLSQLNDEQLNKFYEVFASNYRDKTRQPMANLSWLKDLSKDYVLKYNETNWVFGERLGNNSNTNALELFE